jgi:hypothetical protein
VELFAACSMFRACIYVHRKSHIRAFFDNIDAEHSLGLSSWSYRAIIQDYGLRDPGEVSHGAMVLSITASTPPDSPSWFLGFIRRNRARVHQPYQMRLRR